MSLNVVAWDSVPPEMPAVPDLYLCCKEEKISDEELLTFSRAIPSKENKGSSK